MTHTDPTTRRVPSSKTKRSSNEEEEKEDRVVNICVNAERETRRSNRSCPTSKEGEEDLLLLLLLLTREEENLEEMAQGSPVETFGCWKAKRPGEIREPVAWRGGGEKEGRGARRMDSPVSHSLADRERITMRSLPLLVSLLVLLSDRPFAHPFPSLSLLTSKSVRLSIRSSLRLPPVTLLASLSRRFSRIRNSSPLLSRALSSSSVAPFVLTLLLSPS